MAAWLAIVACVASRDPLPEERDVALTAADLAERAIKPAPVDRRAEEWSVERGYEGWTLHYAYDHAGLSIRWEATVSSSPGAAATNYRGAGLLGGAVGRMPGVTLQDGDAVGWGEEEECRTVVVSELDVGFLCRGRRGSRTYSVSVYGVTPHGRGAPGVVLRDPLAALDGWDPR